jgi:clan AA aspartic protease
LSWSFAEDSLMLPIRIANPFLDAHYPPDGLVLAVLDTGFTGFLLVPFDAFHALKLDELRTRFVNGELANGTSIELRAAYGVMEIPEAHFEDEGLIESNPDVRETLLGVRAIRNLRTLIDGCRKTITTEKC